MLSYKRDKGLLEMVWYIYIYSSFTTKGLYVSTNESVLMYKLMKTEFGFRWVFIFRSDIIINWHIAIFELRHDKTNNVAVRPANTQISLGIRPVWSEFSLWAQWVAKEPSFLHEDSEGTDQTGRMPRLIWVFAGRTLILLVLSCSGSNIAMCQFLFLWSW